MYKTYSLTVPSEVAELVPPGVEFIVEVLDDGILYRPVQSDVNIERTPEWGVRNADGGGNSSTPGSEAEGADVRTERLE